ncbi:hypothetical protein J2X57_003456 [Luteibacter sp. 1214]|nr:hypothetical protein [Luteibacter sp. 1214]
MADALTPGLFLHGTNGRSALCNRLIEVGVGRADA